MQPLTSQNIELILQSPEESRAMIAALSPAERANVSADWLARLETAAASDPWVHGFTIRLRVSESIVGHCGFKGPPSADGIVEIAYGIAPEQKGRGYATEAALALVHFAFTEAAVRIVRAHTRPEPNASTRVLTKCGFRYVGAVLDPEDGLVWRWETEKATA